MKKFISEFIGTFTLVFVGCGSIVAANFLFYIAGVSLPTGFITVTSALALGTTLTAMYYSFAKISDGHFNPAVSLAVFINKGFEKVSDFVIYIGMQLAGGTLGALAIWAVTGQRSLLGQNGYDLLSPLNAGMFQAIAIEIILTCIFVVVFLVARENKAKNIGMSALMVGVAFTAVNFFGFVFINGAANPAISFATAIVALGDTIVQLPVFFLAPLVGGALAAVIYKFVISEEETLMEDEEEIIEEMLEETIIIDGEIVDQVIAVKEESIESEDK